jgi:hypothetical protein
MLQLNQNQTNLVSSAMLYLVAYFWTDNSKKKHPQRRMYKEVNNA